MSKNETKLLENITKAAEMAQNVKPITFMEMLQTLAHSSTDDRVMLYIHNELRNEEIFQVLDNISYFTTDLLFILFHSLIDEEGNTNKTKKVLLSQLDIVYVFLHLIVDKNMKTGVICNENSDYLMLYELLLCIALDNLFKKE